MWDIDPDPILKKGWNLLKEYVKSECFSIKGVIMNLLLPGGERKEGATLYVENYRIIS